MKCKLCIDNDINDKDSGFVRKKISTLLDFKIMSLIAVTIWTEHRS